MTEKFEPGSKRPPSDKDNFKSTKIKKPNYTKPNDKGGFPPRVKKAK